MYALKRVAGRERKETRKESSNFCVPGPLPNRLRKLSEAETDSKPAKL